MKVAVIQLNAQADKAKNIDKALLLTGQAIRKKAELIVLPEAFSYRGPFNHNALLRIAEQIPGETINPFLSLAKRKKAFILLGSICEKSRQKNKAYNTSVLVDDKGQIAAKYRKIHLFNAIIGKKKAKESQWFLSGKGLASANVKGFKIGMSICYDLRFPAMYQKYSKEGCCIFVVPSSFTKKTGKAHWEILLRARAIENFCYVLAPNQTGIDGRGIASFGNSMIIDPWGDVLARASAGKEEIIYANIYKEKKGILKWKKRLK